MAATLDINLLSKRIISFNVIKDILNSYGVDINTISSIDNWMWENEKQIENLNYITKIIEQNKIIIIKLTFKLFKDLGIYIEKIDDEYIYTFWLDTEGYPELDCDLVNNKNEVYYQKIYQIIVDLEKQQKDLLKIVGIGIESDFHYNKDVLDVIQNSYNIVSWILNNDVKEKGILNGYYKKSIEKINKTIFEKREHREHDVD